MIEKERRKYEARERRLELLRKNIKENKGLESKPIRKQKLYMKKCNDDSPKHNTNKKSITGFVELKNGSQKRLKEMDKTQSVFKNCSKYIEES